MEVEVPTVARFPDRRVRRSRAALIAAAIALVSERGTAGVPISEIAEAADVSRQTAYQQFGDRDTLLLEATLELARQELVPRFAEIPHEVTTRARSLIVARHFADHRAFYRAVFSSSCAFALNKALADLLIPANREVIRQVEGRQLDARTLDDLATFVTCGGAAFVNTWVIEGGDPLDPEEFADRLTRMVSVVTDVLRVAHRDGEWEPAP